MKRKPTGVTLGNVYCMDYNDHFSNTDWADVSNPAQLEPVVLQAIGRLVAITPIQYNLEYMSVVNTPNKNHRVVGIMKSCVTRIQDFGPLTEK